MIPLRWSGVLLATFVVVNAPAPCLAQSGARKLPATQAAAAGSATVLQSAQMEGLLPATVYFQGKTAPVQARNSGGIRFGTAGNLLAAVVDNSGYASGVQERYQFYLLTDVPVRIGGERLGPGAYGAGILGEKMIVMDIGGHELFQTGAALDSAMQRPRPLQVVTDPSGAFKLYIGKRWVSVATAQ